MTYNEFLNSTPRQIMTMNDLNIRYETNILLEVASKIYGNNGEEINNDTNRVEQAESLGALFG
uniref:Uncharacterized protein n=1 Tax=Siphoviridae sp. cttaA39 TaxID=2827960 RepID=A0A8S5TMT7_9CAUD|nr:MAG TPA: hypothetical protein [Siphoviridae sp. cttaA39]